MATMLPISFLLVITCSSYLDKAHGKAQISSNNNILIDNLNISKLLTPPSHQVTVPTNKDGNYSNELHPDFGLRTHCEPQRMMRFQNDPNAVEYVVAHTLNSSDCSKVHLTRLPMDEEKWLSQLTFSTK